MTKKPAEIYQNWIVSTNKNNMKLIKLINLIKNECYKINKIEQNYWNKWTFMDLMKIK